MTIIKPPDPPPPRKRRIGFNDDGLSRNQLFYRFIICISILMGLFGAGMMIVAVFGDGKLALRMVNVFSAAFGAFVGLGSGYLLGASERNGDK